MAIDFYKYGLSTPFASVAGEPVLNDTFSAECDEVVEAVKDLGDRGKLRYIHLTDIHIGATLDENRRQCLVAVATMVKLLALDFVLITGDVIAGGNGDSGMQKKVLSEVQKIFASCDVPVIISRGNHDDNSHNLSPDNVLSNDWWNWYMATVFCKASNRFVAPVGENGYYYVDLPEKKIRIVNINCSDLTEQERLETGGQNWLKVSQEQLAWMTNTAFVVDEGWKIICASHMVPVPAMATGKYIENSTDVYNVLTPIADKLIAYHAGHTHVSCNYVDGNGLRFIMANTCGGSVVSAADRRAGYGFSSVSKEARETYPTGAMLFDICIVNQDDTVSRVRWGAKDDVFRDV
jgi:hypothetical protein